MIAPLSRIAQRVAETARRWPNCCALLLGLASATGFAPLGLWPVTLVTLALLMLQMAEAPTQRSAFALGWTFGVGHFALGLNWIATAFTFQAAMPVWLGWVAVLLLALYLAVYPALATWGAWVMTSKLVPAKGGAAASNLVALTFAFAATWIISEWLRSWLFTGFAWNPLSAIGQPLGWPLEVFGTYGTSGLHIIVGGGLIWFARGLRSPPQPTDEELPGEAPNAIDVRGFWVALPSGIALFVLGNLVFEGFSDPYVSRSTARSQITIVQPNVGQQDKWVGEKAATNFAKLANLSNPLNEEPRLILWPEAAIPDYLETGYPWVYYDRSPAEARARLTNLMRPGDLMLLGALKLEMDKSGDVVGARNAVMMVRPDGALGPRYDKAHLVPYGEYLPMRPLLSAIGLSRLTPGDLDFWPGPGPRTLDLGSFGKAGIQICYEIIFSGQVVDRANRPDFIFNPSNDAWFGSWGPPQHLAQARLRAIEEGLPVIRATPTGISAVIDANGRIVKSLPMGVAGRIDADLPVAHAPTLFARFGNILALIFAALLLGLAIASTRRRG